MDNFKQRADVRAAWEEAIKQIEPDVFGTLKFYDGTKVVPDAAKKLLSSYWLKMGRMLFGYASNKGAAINRLCFTEGGELGDNLHMHFVARAPIDTKSFCAILNGIWSKHSKLTASSKFNWITPICELDHVAHYVAKDTWYLKDDEIGTSCSRLCAEDFDCSRLNTEDMTKRIRNALSEQELLRAKLSVEEQIVLSKKRSKDMALAMKAYYANL